MLVLYEYFWSLSIEDHEVFIFMCIRGKIKPNVEERKKGKKLLKDLLINNILSKLILSLNFKTAVFLNKGLVRVLYSGLVVHNSKCFFCVE